ncbi:hypothetical protein ITJ86_13215 [Winogradskyella sp. F6397]|uniref:Trimeric autotransporter adhesin YadA-like head domain-containing protein n=1 Tax=Winogradskyella marina TaxID=2785530 RepID=A0ABS0EQ33_9FLAO|nr:hypothetical protein [Winogradskyella marina]MBF8150866.1 hypothetical protein [Winogradskyella marina]
MKTRFTLILAVLISTISIAQQSINYKALIKDDNGNALINANNINVHFTIYEGAALTREVYFESRPNVSTDANGILIINIGEGVTNYDFSDINWGNDEHWLNVQIDIGDGLVDMGTTQFKTVPYAISAANVSGLVAIDEGNGTGWRLKGVDPANYDDIGHNAVDLSESSSPAGINGASGLNAFAVGKNARASGDHSIAIGNGTKAEGEGSIAMGINNTVEPNALFTIGKGPVNTSSGNAMVIYKTGKSTFYEDMTVNRWLTVKDLFIAEDGMVLTGEINRGGTDDMIPVAYGSVSSTGAIYASGGSFEVTKNAAHTYTITVADPNTNVDLALSHSNSATTVSTISGQFRTSSISHSNGSVRVHIFDSSFGQVANSFQFVIYKQ